MTSNFPLQYLDDDTMRYLIGASQRRKRIAELAGITRRPFTEVEQSWQAIEDHKWFLSERLGRDTGHKVAACDYFENVAPKNLRAQRPLLQELASKITGWVEKLVDSDGPNSLVNFELAMRPRRVASATSSEDLRP